MKTKEFKFPGYEKHSSQYKNVYWSDLYNNWRVKCSYETTERMIDGLTIRCIPEIIGFEYPAFNYSIQLVTRYATETFEYSAGYGIQHGPTVIDLLWSLFMDAECGDDSYEYFCDNFGYNFTRKEGYDIYKACQENARKLRRILNVHYHEVKKYIDALNL